MPPHLEQGDTIHKSERKKLYVMHYSISAASATLKASYRHIF